jgi:magnesium chelatase accessory protein
MHGTRCTLPPPGRLPARAAALGTALDTAQDTALATAQDRALDWAHEGRDWPNRDASRFVAAGGLRWHVQQMGSGPAALLVHGTGAATHSWRGLAPLLAKRWTLLAPDLPGHGFTDTPPGADLSLPGMADALHALLRTLGVQPALAVGHSAGAAVLARMALDGRIAPRALVALNGALLPLRNLPGYLLSPLARLLAANPLLVRLVGWHARDAAAVARLIAGTGSNIEAQGVQLYARLLRAPPHVRGVLEMMARWDLRPLARDLPQLAAPLTLVVGGNDRTVPPSEAQRVCALLPRARLVVLDGLGHLAHEEQPQRVADCIERSAAPAGG